MKFLFFVYTHYDFYILEIFFSLIRTVQRRHYGICEVCKTHQIMSQSTTIMAHLMWCGTHTNYRCDCHTSTLGVHSTLKVVCV